MASVYPAAPLETHVDHAQDQQQLLRPGPPSYDQATTVTPAVTTAPAPSAQHTVIIVPPTVGVYGPTPMDVQCPYCHNYTRTYIKFKPTSRTHLIALLLCLLQLYCFICLPYLISSCMSANHYCGMCDHYLGTYMRN